MMAVDIERQRESVDCGGRGRVHNSQLRMLGTPSHILCPDLARPDLSISPAPFRRRQIREHHVRRQAAHLNGC